MFPTTIWTTIRDAAGADDAARERFARQYREPVARYVRSRGVASHDADDLTQDVFVRLFRSGLLERADRSR
ncbi:MAG: sigma factor, partial [Planctomycetota bacterium JB042]